MNIPYTFNPMGTSLKNQPFVDFLESSGDGKQWIDTLIPASEIIWALIDYQYMTSPQRSSCGWGASEAYTPGYGKCFCSVEGNPPSTWVQLSNSEIRVNHNYRRLKAIFDAEPFTIEIFDENDLKIYTVSGSSDGVTPKTFWLFLCHDKWSATKAGRIRIFRAYLKTLSGKEIDLRPAAVDGEPCMIDILSGQVYKNAGTGSFITP